MHIVTYLFYDSHFCSSIDAQVGNIAIKASSLLFVEGDSMVIMSLLR